MKKLCITKQIYCFLSLAFVSSLLSGCISFEELRNPKHTYENVTKMLERNVEWFDESRIFDFFIQGPTNSYGYGTFMMDGLKIEGTYEIYSKYLSFHPTKKGYIPGDRISFEMMKAFWKNEDVISLKLLDYRGNNSIKNVEELVYIKKRKLMQSELDAKYFFGSKWHDENYSLTFEYGLPFSCEGLYENKYVSLEFLDNRKYSLTYYNGEKLTGDYSSFEDSSLILNFGENEGFIKSKGFILLTTK